MVNVGDVGKDYEHGVQLLKKLSSFRSSGDRVGVQLITTMVIASSGPVSCAT